MDLIKLQEQFDNLAENEDFNPHLNIAVIECRESNNDQILLLIIKFMGNYPYLNDDNYYSTKINIKHLDSSEKIKKIYLQIVDYVKDDKAQNVEKINNFEKLYYKNKPSINSLFPENWVKLKIVGV